MRHLALASCLFVLLGVSACSAAEPEVRSEATFIELMRAAGGSSAEEYTDAELVEQGDRICKTAADNGTSIEEFAELAARMADSSAGSFVALVAEAAGTLCP